MEKSFHNAAVLEVKKEIPVRSLPDQRGKAQQESCSAMSHYLSIAGLFEAQINRGVFSRRSPELDQLISAIDRYISQPDGEKASGG